MLADNQLLSLVSYEDKDLEARTKEWLTWDRNKDTFGEIKELVQKKDIDGLTTRLKTRMEFGTAGLRSVLGAGFSRMNDLTIIQTSQGLCRYLESQFKTIKDCGVIIGHDARYGSYRFARLTAAVFLSQGIKVYLYSNIVPTPFVPYGVRKYNAAAGIMVTASHNPKEDNGYKVYYSNGAQIISPHDKGISTNIMANLEPWESSWNQELHQTSNLCIDPLAEVLKSYNEDIARYCHFRDNNKSSDLVVTYTAMHGVGQVYAEEAFKAFSLKPFVTVKEQAAPDPDFPTVKFPNPEEGKSSLDLSIKTANEAGSRVIVANDPDSDRLAVAEKQTDGSWKIFNGNEIGALLGWWAFYTHKKQHPESFPGDSVYMVHSAVSSKVLQAIGKVEGFKVLETLTGFKWMANKADELTRQGKTVLFAFEEAIGFMFGVNVLDKDGIAAAAVMAEMASWLYAQQLTLSMKLSQIYERYGIHVTNNSYYICHCQKTIKGIFDRIKTMENGTYPSKIGEFEVKAVRDLRSPGYDSEQPNKTPILPVSGSSFMITFQFQNGCTATIRTSGTEPKVKYYSEIVSKPEDRMTHASAKNLLCRVIDAVVSELLQPEKNGFKPRPQ